jgi:hypothetical protein
VVVRVLAPRRAALDAEPPRTMKIVAKAIR